MNGKVIYAGIPFERARRTKKEEKKFGTPSNKPFRTVLILIMRRVENINIQLQTKAE